MTTADITTQPWFQWLEPPLQRSIVLTLQLLDQEKTHNHQYTDYSFVIFPLAKAYEGFLKAFLFKMGLITNQVYYGRRFRIGRALNPDISVKQRDQWWLYDNIVSQCGEDLARKIWSNWIDARNHVFHYFPSETNEYSLPQIEKRIVSLLSVFEEAWTCKLK